MITGYKIKRLNNEEVLYVYLDFNYEFGSFKNVKENLKKNIKEFIEKNKIAFTGTMVALVVGGMVTSSMSLKDDNNQNTNIENEIVISEEISDNLDIPEEIIIDNNEINEVVNNEEKVVEKQIQNENYESPKYEEAKQIENSITQEIKQIENPKIVEEPVVIEPNVVSEQAVTPEIVDTKTYVTVRRSNGEYQNIELEEYIIGVVGAEMPASFHSEALKAQAVIARTYALKAINSGKTLTDNESTQSFKDINQLQSLWGSSFGTYYNKIKNAVLSTEGMYLTYGGNYIEAVYHSTSNGTTENAVNVWGNSFPYLISVESPYDAINPSFIKEKNISYDEISSKLGSTINIDTEFNIISRTSGNRVENIEVNGTIYKGTKFRELLGLRSTDFEITKTDNGVVFTTKGYGHGVGMSQYGANGMAQNGYTYTQILFHYYPGVIIN